MKILVAVKRVIDYNVQIRVKEDGTGIVTDNVKMSSNPPDDNAIEEAVKIKEAGKATEVIAVTVGEEKSQETIRKALAVGVDRGIHVKADGIVEPIAVAKILQKIIEIKDKKLEVVREVDEGLETIEVNIPAVVTCDLRLNEPRYASLPNIMKAKKKPIEQINTSDLGVDITPKVQQIKVEEPPKRKSGIKVASVAELVQKLKNEAKVI